MWISSQLSDHDKGFAVPGIFPKNKEAYFYHKTRVLAIQFAPESQRPDGVPRPIRRQEMPP
jgi:hypothetical protein